MTPLSITAARARLAEAERARQIVMIQMEDAQAFLAMTRAQMRSASKNGPQAGAFAEQLKLAEAKMARVGRRQREVNKQFLDAEAELEQAFRQVDSGDPVTSAASPPAPAAEPPSRCRPPAADAKGFSLKPDPLRVTSAAELVEALNKWRIWAGDVSFRTMARESGRASASAICTALGRTSLPGLQVVLAVVEGCGGTEQDRESWATAWRLLRSGQITPHVADPAPLHVVAEPPATQAG